MAIDWNNFDGRGTELFDSKAAGTLSPGQGSADFLLSEPTESAPARNEKKNESPAKQDRSVFGYVDMPAGADPDTFAQCASCKDFTGKTCLNFRPEDEIVAGGSCNFYTYGDPQPDKHGQETSLATPEEGGYVVRPVRCRNCWFAKDGATKCGFFEYVNQTQPDEFDLDENIKPTSCCNAQTASGKKVDRAKKGLRRRMERLEKSIETVSEDYQRFLNESIASQNEVIREQNSVLIDLQNRQLRATENLTEAVESLSTKKRKRK